jgi:hypothetical protein
MIAGDGSMRLQLTWGQGTMHDINGEGPTSTIGMRSWQPSPAIRYTRNVRAAGERIWH